MTVTIKPSPDADLAAGGQTSGETASRWRKRDSLFLMARLRVGEHGPVREVRVRNLSEGGLMAEYERVVPIETPVMLELRGLGEIYGRVAWCEAQRIGIAFDQPIDPKLARKPVGQGAKTPDYAKAPSSAQTAPALGRTQR